MASASRSFWDEEAVGESKYEVQNIVGKGSYGVVWCVVGRDAWTVVFVCSAAIVRAAGKLIILCYLQCCTEQTNR